MTERPSPAQIVEKIFSVFFVTHSEHHLLRTLSDEAILEERKQFVLERRASHTPGTYDILFIRFSKAEDRYRIRFQVELEEKMVETVAIVVPWHVKDTAQKPQIKVNTDHSYEVFIPNWLKEMAQDGERIKV
ncbi:MAG: hypothetical protein ABI758_05490 [Candidatus Woesebacteria bacterium]